MRRGLIPDGGVAYLLPRLVGMHKAKELVFFGDDLSAADAKRHRHREQGRRPRPSCKPTAKEWAERLASGPTKAIGWSKKLLHDASELSRARPARGRGDARRAERDRRSTRAKGRRAFRERRDPRVEGLVIRELVKDRPRSSASARPRSARGSTTPSCRSRARRSRWRSTTRASTPARRRRAGVVHDGAEPRGRRRAQRRARRHHLLLARSATAAAPAAASSARPRWRSRPASARSRSRGGRASAPTDGEPAVGAGRGRASPTTGSGRGPSACCARSTRSRC